VNVTIGYRFFPFGYGCFTCWLLLVRGLVTTVLTGVTVIAGY